jgi:hypothetical protein
MTEINVDQLRELWDQYVPIRYLLTLKGSDREAGFLNSMEKIGLDRSKFIIIRSDKAKNKEEIDNEIFYSHYQVTKDALNNHSGKNFMIFEDDCRVIDDTNLAKSVTLNALRDVFSPKNSSKWMVVNLGGVSLGPTRKSFASKYVRYSGNMWAAHSYILNGSERASKLADLMKKYEGYGKWKRPVAVEGWSKFSGKEKWMITPNITHQCVIPRVQALIPLAKNMNFQDAVPVWNNITFAITYTIIACIIVLVVIMCTKMTQMCKK